MTLHRISTVWIACIALLIASAQMVCAQHDVKFFTFFLNNPPTKKDLSQLPPSARDVIIAQVRIVDGPTYLGGSGMSDIRESEERGHGERERAKPPIKPEYQFAARLEVIELLKGPSELGARYDVRFAFLGSRERHFKYPHTPRQKTQEYFVASYVAEDMVRRLFSFPVSLEDYANWWKEKSEYRQSIEEKYRNRPAARP